MVKKKGKQGFASMNKEKQLLAASRGGKAAHAKGTAHKWNTKEAQIAGKKGGIKRQQQIKEQKGGE